MLKRRLRRFRLKRFVVYAKCEALYFNECEVAKLSSQTIRGARSLCDAHSTNKKRHFETLRVCVIYAKLSAPNFTSAKFAVARLSTSTLRGLRVYANFALRSSQH
jgi:hypothetical protein